MEPRRNRWQSVANRLYAKTAKTRENRRRGFEILLLSGFESFGGDVHPASTARSIASASRSETACSRLSSPVAFANSPACKS
jgi:hypothetical protein